MLYTHMADCIILVNGTTLSAIVEAESISRGLVFVASYISAHDRLLLQEGDSEGGGHAPRPGRREKLMLRGTVLASPDN